MLKSKREADKAFAKACIALVNKQLKGRPGEKLTAQELEKKLIELSDGRPAQLSIKI